MKDVFKSLFEKIINEKKGFKLIAWIFIILIVLAVVLYPIIDANVLYYNRANKRIEIIQRIISIDANDIHRDYRIEAEYNSIIDDIENQRNNDISNIFQKETNKVRNIVKFVSGAWIFFIIGFVSILSVDKQKGRRFTSSNVSAGIVCLVIGGVLGYICFLIPNIINFGVNIVLYHIIVIFLGYTIATSGKKE